MITNFKLFENTNDYKIEKLEDKLTFIANYFDDNFYYLKNSGFVDCVYDDSYYDRGFINFEFDFITNYDIEDYEDDIDSFLKQYDIDYHTIFKSVTSRKAFREGHLIYTISINNNEIEKLHKEAELYYQTKKYNL